MTQLDDISLFESMIEALKYADLRITRQRKEILKYIINNRSGHLDAELILSDLNKMHIKVSRATIYRTLDVLVQQQIIDKYDFGDGRARYEISAGEEHHDHLVCIECKKIVEFTNKHGDEMIPEICSEHNFTYFNHFLQIYGLCPECRKKNK